MEYGEVESSRRRCGGRSGGMVAMAVAPLTSTVCHIISKRRPVLRRRCWLLDYVLCGHKTNTKMLSRVATTAAKRAAPLVVRQTARSASAVALSGARTVPAAATIPAQQAQVPTSAPTRRSLSAAAEDTDHHLAAYAYEKSCYVDMDFTIIEDDSMYNAIQKFSAFKVGSLVVVDGEGNLTGIISERDYITKLALLGKKSKETTIKEVMTTAANLITGSPDDTVETCMDKMLSRSIRHLPLVDTASGKVVGLLSIKDIIKVLVEEKDAEIKQLTKLALGQDEVV